MGSIFITMPGPPPYGASSVVRCLSVAQVAQIHRLKSGESLFLRALEHAFPEHALANAGKNGENLDFQSISIKGITTDASKCPKSALDKKDAPAVRAAASRAGFSVLVLKVAVVVGSSLDGHHALFLCVVADLRSEDD